MSEAAYDQLIAQRQELRTRETALKHELESIHQAIEALAPEIDRLAFEILSTRHRVHLYDGQPVTLTAELLVGKHGYMGFGETYYLCYPDVEADTIGVMSQSNHGGGDGFSSVSIDRIIDQLKRDGHYHER